MRGETNEGRIVLKSMKNAIVGSVINRGSKGFWRVIELPKNLGGCYKLARCNKKSKSYHFLADFNLVNFAEKT